MGRAARSIAACRSGWGGPCGPAAHAGWRKTAQNMAVPRRFNPSDPGNKNSESGSPALELRLPVRPGNVPQNHVPTHTPPGAGTFQSRVRRPSPRAPGPASSRPGAQRCDWRAGHPEPEPRGGPPDGRFCHMGIACPA
ncbi:hypothetical protein GCM10019016_070070 [Streptomyces prasinosporus]|uniref:Uncharacterized protein n=1 Tax=Streptomyces prasinosporus TaxID=68256 RepID=A0ABP6TZN0_9ACTN